ncbi:MAG: 5-oxoprolinase subunit PxpA [Bacteroidota bacterium]
MSPSIDLNCDMGESWYERQVGNDREIMPYISSCNLACGFHGGDALSMERTIGWALEAGTAIGAHPSYPDRKNFGRIKMNLPLERLSALIHYQIAALKGLVERQGGQLNHLKPHGALYHAANQDKEIALALANVAKDFQIPTLFGPPQGQLKKAALQIGLQFAAEGFADRAYESDLSLRARQKSDAILKGQKALDQAISLAQNQTVTDTQGQSHQLKIDTLCIHGDHPGSAQLAQKLHQSLKIAPVPRGRPI